MSIFGCLPRKVSAKRVMKQQTDANSSNNPKKGLLLVKIKMAKTALHGCVLDPCPERDFDPPLHSRSERSEERVANPPQGRAHGTSRVFAAATRRDALYSQRR